MRKSSTSKAIHLYKMKDGERLMIRAIRCNKLNCRACPHSHYAYATSGYGKARKHRYLGVCNSNGEPRAKYSQLQLRSRG